MLRAADCGDGRVGWSFIFRRVAVVSNGCNARAMLNAVRGSEWVVGTAVGDRIGVRAERIAAREVRFGSPLVGVGAGQVVLGRSLFFQEVHSSTGGCVGAR